MEPVLEPPATEKFDSIPIGNSTASDTTPLSPAFMAENSNDYDADKERTRLQPKQLTPPNNILTHLKGDVDPAQATGPLLAYCFMTGLIDSVSFSAIFVWCGFQTGNGTQVRAIRRIRFCVPALLCNSWLSPSLVYLKDLRDIVIPHSTMPINLPSPL
ncbi:hypothetical protein PILCRDRAFT_290466 [Piloderma croceum F 1598]|uniref:DUF1275 domain protein n=1 Tax=Piloderma croceum (strain F 1598) TaxID=765440 RepID=A0A0C3FS51_PILCF|nr:hypothetical protein PILCRDRAFT_290466 [Piloderma croceum F 1598]